MQEVAWIHVLNRARLGDTTATDCYSYLILPVPQIRSPRCQRSQRFEDTGATDLLRFMTDPHEIRVDEESKLTLHGLLQYYAPWKNLNQMVQMVLQERSIIFYFAAVPFAAQTFHIEPLHLELFTYMLI